MRAVLSRPPDRDAGFTLVEVLLALVLLTVGLAGVAEFSVRAARLASRSRMQTVGAALAVQKMEQMLGLAWAAEPDGVGPTSVRTDRAADLSFDRPTAGGRGLTSPGGSLSFNAPGYVDFLDGHGNWVGRGPLPPATAVYVRRWSVRPAAGASDRSLLLQVLVTPATRVLAPGTDAEARARGDSLLTTVRARKAL